MKTSTVIRLAILSAYLFLSGCASLPSSSRFYNTQATANNPNDNVFWQGSTDQVWTNLHQLSTRQLYHFQARTPDPIKRGYVELALINKTHSKQTPALVNALLTWRQTYPSHPGNTLFPGNSTLQQVLNTPPPQKIAILLPQQGAYGIAGQRVREGIMHAYYDYPTMGAKPSIQFYNTTTAEETGTFYQQAIDNGADFVIGPLSKDNVQQLLKNSDFPKTTLALNYTQGIFNGLPNHFYEFGLLPGDEVMQLADKARQAGLSKAIIIAPNNPWGKDLSQTFSAYWKQRGGAITDTWLFAANSDFNQGIADLLKIDRQRDKKLYRSQDNSRAVLESQRRQDFDVVFIFAPAENARLIVPLLRYYYVTDIPIYASASTTNGPSTQNEADARNLIICDIPWQTNAAKGGGQAGRLYAVGNDAYLLSLNLTRLEALPNFPIYGATGALYLDSNQRIHRRLPCRKITS